MANNPPDLPPHVVWHDTATGVFRYAAPVGTSWWVLRLNDFPEHPLYTLFIDGQCVGDIDDLPARWRISHGPAMPTLTSEQRRNVLQLMTGLGPYNSENGQPCTDYDWCTCDVLTDEYAAQLRPPPTE